MNLKFSVSILVVSLTVFSIACNNSETVLLNNSVVNTQNVKSEKPLKGYFSTGILKIKNKSDINRVLLALKDLKKETTKETGYISFVIQQSLEDPQIIVIWENFKDEESFKLHLESKHLQKFLSLNLVNFVKGYPTKIVI